MNSRIVSLIRKEFTQFFRDKVLVLLVLYAFVEIVTCAEALTLEVNHVATAVLNYDRSAESRMLVEKFGATGRFDFVKAPNNPDELARLLQNGTINLGLVIPADFTEKLGRGETAEVQILADGSNPNTALLASSYAASIIQSYSQNIEIARLGATAAQMDWLPQVVNQIRAWYNPELRYSHLVMLSMTASAVVMLGMILAAATMVREKDSGTLEQLLVTPTRPWELIVAKIVPMALLTIVGLVIALALSVFIFGVPLRGSLLLFFALSQLAFLSSAGIGILVATQAKNMQQALLLVFFILFPMIFLSGSVVRIENMPLALQTLSLISPLRYYQRITVDLLSKGVGLDILWPQVLALALLGSGLFGISLLRFRRTLA